MQKVRDHCHYTGKYRGAAHGICNLYYTTQKTIPIVFHNGSTYDYHFIIKQLAREFKYYLECLGEKQKNILLSLYQLKKCLIKIRMKIIVIVIKIIRMAKIKRLE